ncbi:MAG TPA: glycosyltransferase family 2 protein [Thermoanaerobaculia bacterium]
MSGTRTPVLLVIFKRPDLTRRALAAIAAAKPSKLFIAADGPRHDDEAEKCRVTRETLAEFDFECEVVTNFSDCNLGCGVRVYSAIDWAFTQTDELIILEDDCLPNASFFRFCDELLEHYRDDERVMHISGDNFVGPESRTPYSYYFSKYTHGSGWATWKRAWRHFDPRMSRWPELRDAGIIEAWSDDPYERRYWTEVFDRVYPGSRDIWDYQWNFSCWSQYGLSVLPSVNLVVNDGFGEDATHTKSPIPWPPSAELGEIVHPPTVVRNVHADAVTFNSNFGGAEMKARDTPRARMRRKLEPVIAPLRPVKRMLRRVLSR